MKSRKRWLWLAPLLLIALLAAAFGVYASDYYRPAPTALACLTEEDALVRVEDAGDCIALDGPGTGEGLVFYPGGKVAHTAYLPLLKALARDGVDCFLVKMPFNLAVFGVDRMSDIQAAHDYERWFLAGHSLGGVMAADWARKHPGALEGLALLAAYPAGQLPQGLRVLVIYGSEDSVLNRDKFEDAARYLPEDARIVELPGGNHAQFGDYGPQKGDGAATLSPEAQQRQTADLIEEMVFGEKQK